jgi:hypothetical protein
MGFIYFWSNLTIKDIAAKKIVEALIDSSEEFGLEVNTEKTQ